MSRIRLDFPLCAEPGRDQAVRPLVERAISFVVDAAGPARIEAVILAGSLARGEGSVLRDEASFRLLGDMECLVILRDTRDWPTTRRELAGLSAHATREVGDAGRLATIEYTPAGLGYLRRAIRPSIFAYDLLHGGQVVWGRPDILREVAAFTAADIPREDALRLLMNRIVELLLVDDASPPPGGPRTRAYHVAKVALDLAGSALAFAGHHTPRYRDRPSAFRTRLGSTADLRSALPRPGDFVEMLDWATRCKLAPSDDLLFAQAPERRDPLVAAWAQAFWLWETRRLLGRPLADFNELIDAYLRHEPLGARLRGWAKLWLHPFRPRRTLSLSQTVRWALRSSPHQLIYGAALLALWSKRSAGHGAGWQARAGSLFPLRRPAATNGVTATDISDAWRWLIRTN
jgi:hypothetical protein